MAGMIAHAGKLLNHTGHPGKSPQVGGEPVRAGALAEGAIHAVQVGGIQSRLPSGAPGAKTVALMKSAVTIRDDSANLQTQSLTNHS